MSVTQLVALVACAREDWDPAVERAILGTAEAEGAASIIVAFFLARCGWVSDAVFYRPGVGIVAGLRLSDDTEILVAQTTRSRFSADHSPRAGVALSLVRSAAKRRKIGQPLLPPKPHSLTSTRSFCRLWEGYRWNNVAYLVECRTAFAVV
jgi:hypothetical protein